MERFISVDQLLDSFALGFGPQVPPNPVVDPCSPLTFAPNRLRERFLHIAQTSPCFAQSILFRIFSSAEEPYQPGLTYGTMALE